jgi:hypothetical protein
MSGSKVALRRSVQWIRLVIEEKASSNIYGCIAIFAWNVKHFLAFFGIASLKRIISIGCEKLLNTKKNPLAPRKGVSTANVFLRSMIFLPGSEAHRPQGGASGKCKYS